MKCIAKDLPPADPNLDPAELRREFDKIASENMQSVERLMASRRRFQESNPDHAFCRGVGRLSLCG